MCSGGMLVLKEEGDFKGSPEQVAERRLQLVGSMLQPSDNILLAAAPSGLLLKLCFFH